MKKSEINFIIDALMFFCMAAIAGIGFLMNYVLLSGREVWEEYGNNIELKFLWMDRHTWGGVHLFFGFILLFLLVLHIVLHWKMITGLYKNLITDPKKRRNTALIFLCICFILFIFSFIVSPQKGDFIRGNRQSLFEQSDLENAQTSSDLNQQNYEIDKQDQIVKSSIVPDDHNTLNEIRGFMTFSEIERKYDVPSEYLKGKLRLPETISDNEKLGLMRRKYPFKMSDIEQFIDEYKKN
jgi:hypothetical protein